MKIMHRTEMPKTRTRLFAGLAAMFVTLGGLALFQVTAQADEGAVKIAAPAMDATAHETGLQTAVFSGGCFWGIQGVFEHVKGVKSAISGYTGGSALTAHYAIVSSGTTGHAESVKITYDPKQVSYGTLLQVFFSVAHDPTTLNRQGPDRGPQYRSEIWFANAAQHKTANAYIAQLNKAGVYGAKIVTKVEPLNVFHVAEDYHQDYLIKNPNAMYIVINDIPKIKNLARLYPSLYRTNPVQVAAR